jgi:hypothetical protein
MGTRMTHTARGEHADVVRRRGSANGKEKRRILYEGDSILVLERRAKYLSCGLSRKCNHSARLSLVKLLKQATGNVPFLRPL